MIPDLVLKVGDEEVQRINFGVTPINSESEIELTLFNKGTNKIIDIQIMAQHEDVKVVEHPKELDKEVGGRLILKYRPNKQLDRGINSSVIIKGGYIV